MSGATVVHRFESHQARVGDPALRADWIRDWGALSPDWTSAAGTCPVCNGDEGFALSAGHDPAALNVREDLLCRRCGLNARVRAAMLLLRLHRPAGSLARTYLTEQATPTFAWAQSHLEGEVLGSEFEPDATRREQLAAHLHTLGGTGDVSFGDVTALDHADASLDAIVSFDVLEHVPDYARALGEFRRVLRADGVLVATFPFTDEPATLVRARLQDGAVQHLCEPEFHGDPLGGGVLCWYHFGWDILQVAREAGFAQAQMAMPCGASSGLPYGLWTLVAHGAGR